MNIYDYIVIAAVAVLVFFAVRAAVKKKKTGGCTGNCASCGGCATGDNGTKKK